ncbi:MAG: NUDIX domain-containing protein [Anaerolineales bacterium]
MSQDRQRLDPDRYAVIPRTISFVVRQNEILLIKLASDREGWSGRYNGIGGHIEPGEEPLSAARREVLEETGLSLSEQQLCGIVTVDTGGSPGIGLFVFVGEAVENDLSAGPEGAPAWLPIDRLADYDLVEDLNFLIPQALKAQSENTVFFAAYSYDTQSKLQITLTE